MTYRPGEVPEFPPNDFDEVPPADDRDLEDIPNPDDYVEADPGQIDERGPIVEQELIEVLQRIAQALTGLNIKAERIVQHIEAQNPRPANMAVPVQTVPWQVPSAQAQFPTEPAAPPSQAATLAAQAWRCPTHGTGARLIPAGTSKTSGKAYPAFYVCQIANCKEKPPRAL